jgi:ATP-binding cassette subfamily D (ALD) protein 3
MGNLLSYLSSQPKFLLSLIGIGLLVRFRKKKSVIHPQRKKLDGKVNVGVDMLFFKRMVKWIRVLIPSLFSPEMFYMLLVTGSLIGRTTCDLWVLSNGTAIENAIINRNFGEFAKEISYYCMMMFPIALVNGTLKYGLEEVSLQFRTRMTKYLMNKYVSGFTYYQVSNLDNRISNVDQLLTQDVEKFSDGFSEFYSNVSKPMVDIVIYSRKLRGNVGASAPIQMILYLITSGIALTYFRRPTARLIVKQQQLEGEFRFLNSRLITHSEEIAFYGGSQREDGISDNSLTQLVRHIEKSNYFNFLIGFCDTLITKYLATAVGFFVISKPFFDFGNETFNQMSYSELLQTYYKSGRMLFNLSLAMGRLITAGRGLTRLAGFTERVTQLDYVLNELNKQRYQRTLVDGRVGQVEGSGKVVHQDGLIKFENVPIITPNGDVLIESLDIVVPSGRNVIVTGPNGCGKSSLFRVLAGLWPLFGGVLTKPQDKELFYVPQSPYLSTGNFRDQIIYPDTEGDMRRKGVKISDLFKILQDVQLENLLTHRSWESTEDWLDVLSGGEKQRVAMARLFYHKPQFAILDECTSAVSIEIEGFLYSHSRELGITLFTVSHREEILKKYHDYVFKFDGEGGYSFYEC